MPTWGVVATVKAPEEQVLAFIAHHLALGAACIWIYFDDPNDPAFALVSRLARVKAVLCTDWYWILRGGRHPRVSLRQARNCSHAQRGCRLDWLAHIDVDEYLFAPEPVADILAKVPAAVPCVVMEPFDALNSPDAPDDILRSRHFRGALLHQNIGLQAAIFGQSASLLTKGTLGHTLGKSFCRTGVRGLVLGLHFATLKGDTLCPPFHPTLRLLHFHAQDRAAWRLALPFRLGKGGAYSGRSDQQLRGVLTNASEAVIDVFYDDVMTLTPEKAALLRANDRLITTDLGLRGKVAALLEGKH